MTEACREYSTDQPTSNLRSSCRDRDRRWLFLALAIYVVLVGRILATRHYWPGGDSGTYISAAVALHQGVGLRDITAPIGKPESWARIPTWIHNDPQAMAKPNWPFFVKYPPGLPLLLVPFLWIGNGSFLALQALPFLCGALGLCAVYRWRFELFPDAWRAVLIWTAASQVTLYATRVQTEALMPPLILLAMWLLWRATLQPNRLVRYCLPAALALLAAAFIHPKVIFLCAGAVAWIVIFSKSRWFVRMTTAVLFGVLTILPILWWAQHVAWVGEGALTLSSPNFRTDPYAADSPSIFSQPMVLARQILGMGHRFLESTGIVHAGGHWYFPVIFDIAFYVVLLSGLWAWHRQGRTAIVVCMICHMAGIVCSQTVPSRSMVMVAPLLIYVLIVGFLRILGFVCAKRARWSPRIQAAMSVTLSGALLVSWAQMKPWRDWYCVERNRRYVICAKLAEQLPEDRVALVDRDHYAVALVSGRATLATSPWEWRHASPKPFFEAGGRVVAFWKRRSIESKHLIDYLPIRELEESFWEHRVYSKLVTINDLEFLVGTVGYPLNVAPTFVAEREGQKIPTHIHPRWLRTTRATLGSARFAGIQ